MIAEISVIPIGEGIDLASYVARIVKIIDESGLDYKLNAMGTVVEGDSDRVFDLIKNVTIRCWKMRRGYTRQ